MFALHYYTDVQNKLFNSNNKNQSLDIWSQKNMNGCPLLKEAGGGGLGENE